MNSPSIYTFIENRISAIKILNKFRVCGESLLFKDSAPCWLADFMKRCGNINFRTPR